jgi:hypothetical protein
MRAVVEVINVRSGFIADQITEARVNLPKDIRVELLQSYPALIGYDEHLESGIIELADRFSGSR